MSLPNYGRCILIRVWYSTKTFADYIVAHTCLRKHRPDFVRLYESDASKPRNFHAMPDHIKKILYLDAPDIIVEKDGDPILAIEESKEAGTGHNAFQRFARLAASVENGVPVLYVYPEAVQIKRRDSLRWDALNPLIFRALEKMMRLYDIPALLFYYPSFFSTGTTRRLRNKGLRFDRTRVGCPLAADTEMQAMFDIIYCIVQAALENRPRRSLLRDSIINERRDWMLAQDHRRDPDQHEWAPLTSSSIVPTQFLMNYLGRFYRSVDSPLLRSREESIIYHPNAKFRGDPYPGALAAIDYLKCRTGETYEDRGRNLVMCWGGLAVERSCIRVQPSSSTGQSINMFVGKVRSVRNDPSKCLLDRCFSCLRGDEIPRYYMQARYGCTFTKSKEIRCFAYFADAMIFHDGALWREG